MQAIRQELTQIRTWRAAGSVKNAWMMFSLAVVIWRRSLRESCRKRHVKNSNPSRRARNRHIVTHHEIAMCAYGIWEQEGRPAGRALDHWLQAELQLVLSSVWGNDFQGDALEKPRPIVRTRPFSVLSRPEPISAQPYIHRTSG